MTETPQNTEVKEYDKAGRGIKFISKALVMNLIYSVLVVAATIITVMSVKILALKSVDTNPGAVTFIMSGIIYIFIFILGIVSFVFMLIGAKMLKDYSNDFRLAFDFYIGHFLFVIATSIFGRSTWISFICELALVILEAFSIAFFLRGFSKLNLKAGDDKLAGKWKSSAIFTIIFLSLSNIVAEVLSINLNLSVERIVEGNINLALFVASFCISFLLLLVAYTRYFLYVFKTQNNLNNIG